MCPLQRKSYYEHCDQDVLLGDLGMREDVLQHRTHVRFVLLSQVDNTLVIVSCLGKKKKEEEKYFNKSSTAVTIKKTPYSEFFF